MKSLFTILLLAGFATASNAVPSEPWRIPDPPLGPVSVTAAPTVSQSSAHGPARVPSWPQPTADITATPVFVDLNSDGISEVVACDSRSISAYTITGSRLWNWQTGDALMHPAAADIDDDGHPEIALATSLPTAQLWLLDNGGIPLSGWPVSVPFIQLSNLTCPVLVDLDGDGNLDVGVAGEKGVFFYDRDGTPLAGWPFQWNVPINNPQWSAPAVGDVNGDGAVEVAVGNACYPNWGVYLLRSDGTVMPGWPKVIEPVFSSPALADLDGDGHLEIIAQEGDPGSQGSHLWVWHYDGTVLPGWPQTISAEGYSSRCNPAVADVQADGIPEIVTFTGDSRMHIFLPSGAEMAGYPKTIAGVQPIASPSVLDVNNDGRQEIFLTYWLSSSQYVSGWNLGGQVLPGFPKTLYTGTDMNSHASTHVMDADNDGIFEMTAAGTAMNAGQVFVFDVDGSTSSPNAAMDWPKIRQNLLNHGRYLGPDPAGLAGNGAVRPSPLRIAPNPVSPYGRITLRPPEGGAGYLTICDPAGRVIGSRSLGGASTLGWRELSGVHGRAAGVYLVRWSPLAGGATQTAHIVVLAD